MTIVFTIEFSDQWSVALILIDRLQRRWFCTFNRRPPSHLLSPFYNHVVSQISAKLHIWKDATNEDQVW